MNSTHANPSRLQILLASSRSDPAGCLIHEEIMKILSDNPAQAERYQHRQYDERLIYIDGHSLSTDADQIIFLSRHASVDPRPVLTVHGTGNFSSADFGGEPKTITPAATAMMHALLNRLAAEVPEGYDVTYEATHHGPTSLPVPSCFIEVGSTMVEWNDRNAASAVARAVIGAEMRDDTIRLAGFGGTHYAKRQTEITLTTRGGFGHIMPSRDLARLDRDLFRDIITASAAQAVYIDRKSVSKDDIRQISDFARNFPIPVLSQSDLNTIKSLSFSEYQKIKAFAEEILPGASVDIHGLDHADELVSFTIPRDLISEAEKDETALKAGLSTIPAVRLSGNGMAYYQTFITNKEDQSRISDDLIHLCVSIIQRNSHCRFEGEYLVIIRQKFDPAKARELGVPVGPEFGRLMKGDTIQVQNSIITPEMVMSTTEKRIHIPGWGI